MVGTIEDYIIIIPFILSLAFVDFLLLKIYRCIYSNISF